MKGDKGEQRGGKRKNFLRRQQQSDSAGCEANQAQGVVLRRGDAGQGGPGRARAGLGWVARFRDAPPPPPPSPLCHETEMTSS